MLLGGVLLFKNRVMQKIIITTSWDDGHKMDLKLLSLLNKYNLKGTFYIPKNCEFKSLTNDEIKEINKSQEIGAHSLSHLDLTKLSLSQAKKEIGGSKNYLENLLNKQVKMFCYPKGKFNSQVKDLVKNAGFLGARTTQEFHFNRSSDFFELGTTIHIYPFPLRKRGKNHYHISRVLFQPLQQKFSKILKLGLPIVSFFSWQNLAKCLFDYALRKGDIYHLWGHSWEIEKYNMWNDLEKIFKYISNRKNCVYLTNREVLQYENFNFIR